MKTVVKIKAKKKLLALLQVSQVIEEYSSLFSHCAEVKHDT